ncbi:hypothetical protein [Rufibacter immobilis]|uniref:hypothetical protein n=1 Tax=Rufibacter immobilis TaxID=1348778 RepID=UPI0011CEB098|nr:hypothetical protein [Rufibacter immobilis]
MGVGEVILYTSHCGSGTFHCVIDHGNTGTAPSAWKWQSKQWSYTATTVLVLSDGREWWLTKMPCTGPLSTATSQRAVTILADLPL